MAVETLYQVISNSNKESNAIVIPTANENQYTNISYAQFFNDSKQIANLLKNSALQKGDVVSIVIGNGYPILACFLGTTLSRCIAAPLNSAYTCDEFLFYLKDMEAKLVIIQSGLNEAKKAATELGLKIWEVNEKFDYDQHTQHFTVTKTDDGTEHVVNGNVGTAAELAELPEPSDVALFLHTSGTTSRPKGVPLTHKNITTSIGNIARVFHLSPSDRSMVVMPLFHVHGLIGVSLSTIIAGGSLVIPPRFSASIFWHQIKQFKVTWYSAVPTIHSILISIEKSIDNSPNKGVLRFIRSCSSSLSPTLLESLEKCFGCPIVESYGMTEACHQMTSNLLPEDGKRKAGSVGKAAFVEVGVADDNGDILEQGQVGEVCVKGENIMHGYHNNPQANIDNFTKHGWFLTGDIGYLDQDGFLILKGRKKEIINRGGEKISPLEVDNALLENEHIAEAVCFGVPDAKYGEEIWAAVVPKESKPDLTDKEVNEFLQKKIVGFKIPKKIFVTQSFPKTSTGKIQRRFISEHFLKLSNSTN